MIHMSIMIPFALSEIISRLRVSGLTKIQNLLNKFRGMVSVQDKKRKRCCTMLTEETLEDIGHRLKNCPKNLFGIFLSK